MTAELIFGVTATMLVLTAVVITYFVVPPRRPFIFDLLDATVSGDDTRRDRKVKWPRGKTEFRERTVLPA